MVFILAKVLFRREQEITPTFEKEMVGFFYFCSEEKKKKRKEKQLRNGDEITSSI